MLFGLKWPPIYSQHLQQHFFCFFAATTLYSLFVAPSFYELNINLKGFL
ncbi:hypothetical protein PTRA_a2675 [Pseudoalteromonas translucida KMM 520]|uniref:Uncharacterized protein n=1 Tax=Pseudoalteromonas translucida KMM 520 TaxID=1315283 RepID=A0A0U2V7J1_9GAMM|nr:hypothetical protein PTRA_a2675 [Pseudoalteromonas translucida KMM 520]